MNKLILLCGESSAGKTTALKMLIAKLLQDPALQTKKVYCHYRSQNTFNQLKKWKKRTPLPEGDLSVVLDCKGVRVGICTDGDTIGAVWDHIVFFEKKNAKKKQACAVGVTACHPEHLDRSLPCMVAPWECHKIFEKKKASNENEENENMDTASALFDEILKEITLLNAQNS